MKSVEFKGGAKRSGKKLRFDLIFSDMPDALTGIAERCTIGAQHYGDHNWKKGGPDFVRDMISHTMQHLLYWNQGEIDDEHELIDHLKAFAWNAMAILQYYSEHPEEHPKLKKHSTH